MVFKWFLNGFLNGLFGPLIVASRTSTQKLDEFCGIADELLVQFEGIFRNSIYHILSILDELPHQFVISADVNETAI